VMLEIVLGILIIIGTLAGTGLGYALSMRGKREEWAKEYREKRLNPLSTYINEYMEAMLDKRATVSIKERLQKKLEETTDDEQRVKIAEDLVEANDKLMEANNRLIDLISHKSWIGFCSPADLDEQLGALCRQWFAQPIEPTDENLEEKLMPLAKQILARADEVIIKGGETPKLKKGEK